MMKVVNVTKLMAIVPIAILFISGCSSTEFKYPNTAVRVSRNEPGKECKYIGDATGNQGNFFTGGFTSNSNLETGAMNDLKNKAAAQGGNLVVILTDRAGATGSSYKGTGSSGQTNVTILGSVYKCPTDTSS